MEEMMIFGIGRILGIINKKLKLKWRLKFMFKLHSKFEPTGDQPQAIEKLVNGIENGEKHQTLLGVTGSRKNIHYGKCNS